SSTTPTLSLHDALPICSFRLASQGKGETGVTVGPGAMIGEMALLTETQRPVTATACEPSTVMRIPRTLFLKMLEGYPDAARRLRSEEHTSELQSLAYLV